MVEITGVEKNEEIKSEKKCGYAQKHLSKASKHMYFHIWVKVPPSFALQIFAFIYVDLKEEARKASLGKVY